MTFLLGKTNENRTVSDKTAGAHDSAIDWVTSQGYGGLNPQVDMNSPEVQAFQKLFRDQNAMAFGQAKESAGSLTGSGFGNYLGQAAGQAANSQGAYLANFLEQRRQNDANRFLQTILGLFGSPAAQIERTRTPGLLETVASGVGQAAPFFVKPPGAQQAGGGNASLVDGNLSRSNPTNGIVGQAGFYRFPNSWTPAEGTGSSWGGFYGPQDRGPFGIAPNRPRAY